MSWKEILKIALDKEGNSYGNDKWLEGPLTGPAMVLAEKRETPMYVLYLDDEDGLMYDDLKQAEEASSKGGGDITVIKPTDKKTLMVGLDLYRKMHKKDYEDYMKDYNPNEVQIIINDYLKGADQGYNGGSRLIYSFLQDALLASENLSFHGEDNENAKEQLKEVLEELDYMRDNY